MTSIVTSLTDFEQLLVIAKRHGLTEFRIGEIAVVMPQTIAEEKSNYVNIPEPSPEQIDLELFKSTLTL